MNFDYWQHLDELWQARHDAAPLQVLQNALASAQVGPEETYQLRWRQARLAHFRAMLAEAENQQNAARDLFAQGAKQAQEAMALGTFDVEGHFWRGVCLIEAARKSGKMAVISAFPEAQKQVERAMNIDESYHFAGPLRVLGRMTHLKPLILGGSLDRAMELYRRALQLAPENSTTLLYLAEALLADEQPREARQTLRRILDAPADTDWIWEQSRDKRRAGELLERMG